MLEKEEILKINTRKLLKMQLSLESYADDNDDLPELLYEVWKEHGDYRKIRNNLTIDKQIELSNKIVDKYNKVFDIVGREHFIFYDDGDINYIWKEKNNG